MYINEKKFNEFVIRKINENVINKVSQFIGAICGIENYFYNNFSLTS